MSFYFRPVNTLSKLLLMFSVVMLTACGYHLGSALEVPPEMNNVFFQNASPQLIGGATQVFRSTDTKLVGAPSGAGVVVNVFHEEMRRQSLSLDKTGKAIEYELNYYLDFELLDAQGEVLLPRQEIQVTRDYFNVQLQVIGKANEEYIIRQEMYKEAVQTMVRRVRVAYNAKTNQQ